jgi:7-keto-8-aminopelargonate synthetase-like enzyme
VPKRVRQVVLDRDPWCKLRYGGVCTGRSTQADHIVNVASQGVHRSQAVDPADMQGVCAPCHKVKSRREQVAATAAHNKARAARRRQPVQPHPGD